jgi:predicted transcriptional regulator
MCANPLSDAIEPDCQTVFGALTSEPCRSILQSLERPLTASEVAEHCGLAEGTTYRALERLVDAGLLRKQERERAATYAIDFDEVVVSADGDDLDLEVTGPSRSAAEQLSVLWDSVQEGAGGG